jgi:thiosulfate dehydrogenase [quinone] large subunit
MQVLNSSPNRDQQHAYVFLRLLTGLDFFGHGFVRIFTGNHLYGFAHTMATGMKDTPLPPALTLGSGYVIPCVELLVGAMLLCGVATRFALTLAGLLMFVLMFGVTLKQDWASAGTQLVYGLVLAVLFFTRAAYDVSWPLLLRSFRSPTA